MKRTNLSACLVMMALAFPAMLRAADPPPVPVLRVSVQSTDAAAKLATELGLSLPDPAAQIESALSILQPGSIAHDKPLGVVMLASDALPSINSPQMSQAVVFALPIAPGKMSLSDLLTNGNAAPDPTAPGVLSMGRLNLKRTLNYLFLETGNAPVISPITDNLFAGDYLDKSTLACASLDLAALRKAAPEGYKNFLDTVNRNSTAQQTSGTPANVAGQRMGQQFVLDTFNRLEKLDLAISEDGDSLRLKTWITPYSGNPAAHEMPLPAFPAGTLAHLHLIYPDADAATWFSKVVDMAATASAAELSPAQVESTKTALHHLARLYTGGQALSIGFTTTAGHPLLYLVSQSAQPLDYTAETAALIKEWQTATATQKDTDHLELSTYQAAGKTISRITATTGSRGPLYLDGLANGNMLFVTMSEDPRHFVSDLAAAGTDGKSATLCSGFLNLEVALSGILDAANVPLPAPTADLLKKAFAGQTISWTAQPSDKEGHSLCVDVKVPKQVIKSIITLATSRAATQPAVPQ